MDPCCLAERLTAHRCPFFDQRGCRPVGLPRPDLVKTPPGLPGTDGSKMDQTTPPLTAARWSGPGTKGRLCPAQTQQQQAYLQVPPGPHRCFLDLETALGVQASWSSPFKLAPRVKQPSVSLRPELATGVLGFRKECVWTTRACAHHEHIGVYMHVCHTWARTHVSVSTSGGLRVQLCACMSTPVRAVCACVCAHPREQLEEQL